MEKKKLLIVEDEPMIRKALIDRFSQEDNLMVIAAKDGRIGLDAALRDHPDFILIDVVMPIMSGTEMLEKIRQQDEWGKNVPAMFLSNMSSSEKIAEAVSLGVYKYVIKSNVDIEQIVEQVKEKL